MCVSCWGSMPCTCNHVCACCSGSKPFVCVWLWQCALSRVCVLCWSCVASHTFMFVFCSGSVPSRVYVLIRQCVLACPLSCCAHYVRVPLHTYLCFLCCQGSGLRWSAPVFDALPRGDVPPYVVRGGPLCGRSVLNLRVLYATASRINWCAPSCSYQYKYCDRKGRRAVRDYCCLL